MLKGTPPQQTERVMGERRTGDGERRLVDNRDHQARGEQGLDEPNITEEKQ
ncbi:MAG: hypothetical protein H7Y39_07190 [Nitrospiraceae bacterium]|nr:hypothetical protein [Nitrospiraceae bacterium]